MRGSAVPATAMLAALAVAIAPVSGTPAPPAVAGPTWDEVASRFARLNIQMMNKDRELLDCEVSPSTGDDEVDEAICLLIQRCVEGGAVTRPDANRCVGPYLRRLQGLVKAGAFTKGADDLPETPGDPPDAIVVRGRKAVQPDAGLWLVSSWRTASDSSDGALRGAGSPVSWRRCIATETPASALALLMKANPLENAESPLSRAEGAAPTAASGAALPGGASAPAAATPPAVESETLRCGWKMTPGGGTISGALRCVGPRGSLYRGSLAGRYTAVRYAATADISVTDMRSGATSHETRQIVARRVRDCTAGEQATSDVIKR
ncbi:hypothetical protein GCM10011380_30380 [Sphingomonas metalli]|uniref:DUF3617 family protein n=1 Tax=Sphingomonas metalli TaxID=1779358 RepID=A0A916TBA0_9SPHN|nr:hypothetical protein [Sphingomonas metalli]GGB38857.1 hypothetical protein GCM10011380_30380 [Sphingomonas metalli]